MNCEEIKQAKTEEENEKYKLILEYWYNDFINQDSRKINTDTKTSYLLVVIVFILGILFQNNLLDKIIIKDFFTKGHVEIIFRILLILCYIADLVFCIISMCFFINVLINKKYKKINTELWNVDDAENATYLEVVKGLIDNYSMATKENSQINNAVLKGYKEGIRFLMLAVFFTVGIYLIISFF